MMLLGQTIAQLFFVLSSPEITCLVSDRGNGIKMRIIWPRAIPVKQFVKLL